MTIRDFLVPALVALSTAAAAQEMTVNRSPECGCCEAWASAMADAGFDVTLRSLEADALDGLKADLGIAPELAGCHTALVEGYVIEGHVPAEDLRRLLAEAPEAIGLAAPGMPIGSPGMEMGGQSEPYDVMLIAGDGTATVFARHE